MELVRDSVFVGEAMIEIELRRELRRAETASAKACERRASLPPGSSRAKVTTANAKWMRASEHRDRIAKQLAELREVTS